MEIAINGHYYFRDHNHALYRITIVDRGDIAGFYRYVEGHLTPEEIAEKQPKVYVIHQNRITQ